MKNKKMFHEILDLVYSEHVSNCDSQTCDISSAYNSGFGLWACYIFSSSGAASEEFRKFYKKIPKKVMEKMAEYERKQFVKLPHSTCTNCDGVVWDINADFLDVLHCDDCGKDFYAPQLHLHTALKENI